MMQISPWLLHDENAMTDFRAAIDLLGPRIGPAVKDRSRNSDVRVSVVEGGVGIVRPSGIAHGVSSQGVGSFLRQLIDTLKPMADAIDAGLGPTNYVVGSLPGAYSTVAEAVAAGVADLPAGSEVVVTILPGSYGFSGTLPNTHDFRFVGPDAFVTSKAGLGTFPVSLRVTLDVAGMTLAPSTGATIERQLRFDGMQVLGDVSVPAGWLLHIERGRLGTSGQDTTVTGVAGAGAISAFAIYGSELVGSLVMSGAGTFAIACDLTFFDAGAGPAVGVQVGLVPMFSRQSVYRLSGNAAATMFGTGAAALGLLFFSDGLDIYDFTSGSGARTFFSLAGGFNFFTWGAAQVRVTSAVAFGSARTSDTGAPQVIHQTVTSADPTGTMPVGTSVWRRTAPFFQFWNGAVWV